MRIATAVAHPNIALAKYWGKRERPGNYPAVPSVSVTLAGMSTKTTVRFDPALQSDALVLNGRVATAEPLARASELLDRVRAECKLSLRAHVESVNDFPTASGLASSASGFAALALAASTALGAPWEVDRISDAARRSSASAARSLFGGFVRLDAGSPGGDVTELLAARPIAAADHIDIRVLVCVTSEAEKDVSSRNGMNITAKTSPFYAAWVEDAPRVTDDLERALVAKDVAKVGELMERSTFAMHASAFAAGVRYMRPATLAVLDEVLALRARGIGAWATMDAGPHVKVFVAAWDAAAARSHLEKTSGVLRLIEARPGGPATVAP
ncbi:diphosphomevalonate decarboxylase [soil metagenome]